MWNDPQALNRISNSIVLLSVLMLIGAVMSRAANMDAFAIEAIALSGDVEHVTQEQVLTVATGSLEGTFFTVDLERARTAFETLPWVRRVDIRRRWPNRLDVVVEEHHELARWGNTGLVNTYGELFEGASNKHLPVFEAGEGAHEEVTSHYLQFDSVLADIGRKVARIQLSERRAWRLYLDDGTIIELGRGNVVAKLNGFASVYERSVAGLKGGTRYVDLRYANGFAVRVGNKKWSEARA